jgi:hypothetical protein
MKLPRGLLTILCSVVWVASAEGSTCIGTNAAVVGQTRAGAQLNFGDNTWGVGGGVGKQFDQFFAVGGAAVQDRTGSGTATGIFGTAGVERAMGAEKKFFVCPIAHVLFGFAEGVKSLTLSFGGQVGFVATKAGNTQLVPTFGGSFNIVRASFSGGGSETEPYGAVQGGIGLLFDETKSLTPMIAFAFHEGGSRTQFIVVFSMKVGQ